MPTKLFQKVNAVERFWAKVNKTDGCWLWTACKLRSGYGQFCLNEKMLKAHRVSWEMAFGTIPPGLLVLHKCDVPACVRPDHLFLGTQQENMDDCKRKGRTTRGRPLRAVLTKDDVLDVREAFRSGRFKQTELAKLFFVAPCSINDILKGRTWADLR